MAEKSFNRTVEAINVLLDKLDNLPVVPMAKKGTLMNPSYLPEDAKEGDVYLVLYSDSGNTQTANSLYYKTASNWEIIATKGYTPYEIDQMFEAVGGGLHWKGAVSYYSNLPSNAELGDMWTVLYEGSSGSEQSGDEYAWGTLSGTEQWILIGKETYSKTQIDDIVDGLADEIETNKNNILFVADQTTQYNKMNIVATTTTIDGVTFTVNVDKSITITGSQNNPSAHTKFILCNYTATNNLILYAPESVQNKYFVNTQDGVTTTNGRPEGAEITGSDIGTARDYQIVVIAGTSNINVTMHPMIIPKDIFNAGFTEYQPYAMSNAELTAAIQAIQAQLANQ